MTCHAQHATGRACELRHGHDGDHAHTPDDIWIACEWWSVANGVVRQVYADGTERILRPCGCIGRHGPHGSRCQMLQTRKI
jgi:hypothetical protein